MAAYNNTLGRFQLTGIPPAPRGVPQIEVTFDIDANGIVHVSAKDQASGNEQKIEITASSNLSEDDIKKAIKDAELHASEDQKRKEEIETRNNAESLIYTSEKALEELGDKISSEEKAKVETEIENTRKALETNDVAGIKEATDKLQKTFFDVSSKMYGAAQQANQQANQQAGGPQVDENGNVYGADYNVENDEENN